MNRRTMLKKLLGGTMAVPAAIVAGAELIKQEPEEEVLPHVSTDNNESGIVSYTWTTTAHPNCRCVIVNAQTPTITWTAPTVSNTEFREIRLKMREEIERSGI